jgi:hypothetical protein
LLANYIKWPSSQMLKKYAKDLKALHGILFIIGAIDGMHILIIAPRLHAVDYYNRIGFQSILL